MNITHLPITIGPLDLILKYSNNYSACFRTCRLLRAVVDRIFKDFLKKDFETESKNPYLDYQRKKFALYSNSPSHGLSILEGFISFISFNEKYYAYANFSTVVRDRRTNSVVLSLDAAPRGCFGFESSNLLRIDGHQFSIEENANNDQKIERQNFILPFAPYSLEKKLFKRSHNIVGYNNEGLLDIFLEDSKKFIQTSAEFPEKIYYIHGRLLLYCKEYLIEYDYINQKTLHKVFISSEQFISVIDIDNDYVLVNLKHCKISIIHIPTQRYLHSFYTSDWTIKGFDCMIFTSKNAPHTQRRYYLKKSSNEVSHFSA